MLSKLAKIRGVRMVSTCKLVYLSGKLCDFLEEALRLDHGENAIVKDRNQKLHRRDQTNFKDGHVFELHVDGVGVYSVLVVGILLSCLA